MTDVQYYCLVSAIFLVGSHTATDKGMRTIFGIGGFVSLGMGVLSIIWPAVF